MHMRLLPLSLLAMAMATVTLSAATESKTTARRGLNPESSRLQLTPPSKRQEQAYTNAQRLSLGLPLKKPRRRSNSARKATTSSTPPTTYCNILVSSSTNTYGYISPTWNSAGEYGAFQSGQAGALKVSFSYSPAKSRGLDFTATNGPDSEYPYFGGIIGSNSGSGNLGQNSANYAVIGGTAKNDGAPAKGDNSHTGNSDADIESGIWEYNPNTKAITASWVNNDGNAVGASIGLDKDEDILFLTGNHDKTVSTCGVRNPDVVTFKCVPTS